MFLKDGKYSTLSYRESSFNRFRADYEDLLDEPRYFGIPLEGSNRTITQSLAGMRKRSLFPDGGSYSWEGHVLKGFFAEKM